MLYVNRFTVDARIFVPVAHPDVDDNQEKNIFMHRQMENVSFTTGTHFFLVIGYAMQLR